MIRRSAFLKDPKAATPRTVAILDRMLRMAELLSQRMKPKEIINQIVGETGCSASAAWRTWQTRKDWLPKIVKVPEELGEAFADIILDLREARRLSLNLYYTANWAPGAQVGALRNVGDFADREFKMRQSIGDLPTEPIKLEHKTEVSIPEFNAEDIARYIDTIVEVALAEEARDLNADDTEPDTEEPVD